MGRGRGIVDLYLGAGGILLYKCRYLKGTRSIVAIWVKNLQTELIVEIYSKSLVRVIGKIFHMKLS